MIAFTESINYFIQVSRVQNFIEIGMCVLHAQFCSDPNITSLEIVIELARKALCIWETMYCASIPKYKLNNFFRLDWVITSGLLCMVMNRGMLQF